MTVLLSVLVGVVLGVAGTWAWLIGYILREYNRNAWGKR